MHILTEEKIGHSAFSQALVVQQCIHKIYRIIQARIKCMCSTTSRRGSRSSVCIVSQSVSQ